MRRRILVNNQSNNGGPVEPSEANVCDVVFANKNNKILTIISGGEKYWSLYPKSNYTPIGIVVVPSEHGVLKDGTGTLNHCGVMSLVPMDYNSPENGGTSEKNIYFGHNQDDISNESDGLNRYDSYNGNGLINYNVVCHIGNNGNPKSTIQGTNAFDYLPSDNFNEVANPYDTETYYAYNSNNYYAPSPYKNDGSYNPIYGQTTSPSSPNNALSDFKGIVNTKIITDLATGQSDWKTASTITHSVNSGYYPAACCCARFKTTGTKAFVNCSTDELKYGTGFWYLPACGELGYIIPRLKQINQTISSLKSIYGIGVQLDKYDNWTSSDYDGTRTRCISTYYGEIGHGGNAYALHVRAFMQL